MSELILIVGIIIFAKWVHLESDYQKWITKSKGRSRTQSDRDKPKL